MMRDPLGRAFNTFRSSSNVNVTEAAMVVGTVEVMQWDEGRVTQPMWLV